MVLKLLPLLLVAGLALWLLTLPSRMVASLRRSSQPVLDRSILEIGERLADTLGAPPFELRVFELDGINGLAAPDGAIYISSGLRRRFVTGSIGRDELVAVIAHEIGHLALGHHRRRITLFRAQTALWAAVLLFLSRALFGPFWLAIMVAMSLWGRSMVRRHEYEADAFAAQIMMRAGYDPHAAIRLLSKLEQADGGRSSFIGWWIGYPRLADRRAYVERVIAAGPAADSSPGGQTAEA